MSPMRLDPPRLRLDPVSYENLRQQVLHRDGWRCQSRGTMSNLEAHHKEFRSHSGHDYEENLITLCTRCHAPASITEETDHERGETHSSGQIGSFPAPRSAVGSTSYLRVTAHAVLPPLHR